MVFNEIQETSDFTFSVIFVSTNSTTRKKTPTADGGAETKWLKCPFSSLILVNLLCSFEANKAGRDSDELVLYYL